MSSASFALSARPAILRTGRGQLLLFLGAYVLYSMSRHVAVGDLDIATRHAHWIVDLERAIAADVEQSVQSALGSSVMLWLLNHVYLAAQLIVVPGALVWLYRRRARGYVTLRNTVIATWLLALPVYAAFPVAPPRLADVGIVDTITSHTGVGLNSKLTTSFYNPLAAVPSLHAGFALAVSLALAAAVGGTWRKLLALAWAPLVCLSVVATGNHFVFDIVAGFAITGLGYAVGRLVRGPQKFGDFTDAGHGERRQA
jgi:membrane-associated phospholipid phosphatase